jgi:hypothetical protein
MNHPLKNRQIKDELQKLAIAALLGVAGTASSVSAATLISATLGETIVQRAIAQSSVIVSSSTLTKEALFNAEYQVPDYGKFRLVNGQYIYKTGASKKTSIKLETYTAVIDINKDGAKDAVVVLSVNPGDPHNYKFLAIVINQQGSPVNIDSVYLGDGIKVKKIALQASGELVVSMMNRQQNANKTVKFKLEGGRLVRA